MYADQRLQIEEAKERGMADVESGVPLSSEAQDAKEAMQQQLVRKMALKMLAEAEERERERRIQEAGQPPADDAVRQRALEQIITVQEDLVRALNRMKVSVTSEPRVSLSFVPCVGVGSLFNTSRCAVK